ncbi:MAG: hypothetical protein ABT03_14780 [Comamonas sp. SCN 67-35]|nr:MAG: hypothetical protein ABT03_14780 [Comamonas sp. SCN 67-35]
MIASTAIVACVSVSSISHYLCGSPVSALRARRLLHATQRMQRLAWLPPVLHWLAICVQRYGTWLPYGLRC